MNRRNTGFALAMFLLLVAAATWSFHAPQAWAGPKKPSASDAARQTKPKAAAPAPASVIVSDKGKFRILLDGQPVGSEEFEISPAGNDWQAHGSTEIRAPGAGTVHARATLKLASDGTPIRYEWSVQAQKKTSAVVEFQNGQAKIAAQLGGSEPFLQMFSFASPRVIILDNNIYHHYAVLARIYDWNAKGAQTFPVLIPQGPVPGTITVEALGPQEVEGARLEMLRVQTPDIEVNLYLDSGHRLIRLAVPASRVAVVRE